MELKKRFHEYKKLGSRGNCKKKRREKNKEELNDEEINVKGLKEKCQNGKVKMNRERKKG